MITPQRIFRTLSLIAAPTALFVFLSIPFEVFAQTASSTASSTGSFIPLTQLPGLSDVTSSATLPAFLNQLYKICIGAAAVIAVLEIMVAGAQFMTSRGSVSSNEAAKSRIQNAILGLVLVLSPTIVFGIINPDILKLDLDFSELQPKQLSDVDTTAAPTSTTCTQAKVVTGTATNACSTLGAGYTAAAATCCAGMSTGNTCCSLTSTEQYQLAWYYTKENKSTKYKCYTSFSSLYGSTAQCTASLDQAKKDLASQSSESTTWGSINVLKNCVLSTEGAYTVPAPDNLPKCPN